MIQGHLIASLEGSCHARNARMTEGWMLIARPPFRHAALLRATFPQGKELAGVH